MEKVFCYSYKTVIGDITIASMKEYIVALEFGKKRIGEIKETDTIKKAYQQLDEYLKRQRKEFDLQYKFLTGTNFQQECWNALLDIPYKEVQSYKDIAIKIGSSKACRAVGNANHHNPIAIFIPCHRVIQSNGKLGGYSGGVDIKRFLLSLERTQLLSDE